MKKFLPLLSLPFLLLASVAYAVGEGESCGGGSEPYCDSPLVCVSGTCHYESYCSPYIYDSMNYQCKSYCNNSSDCLSGYQCYNGACEVPLGPDDCIPYAPDPATNDCQINCYGEEYCHSTASCMGDNKCVVDGSCDPYIYVYQNSMCGTSCIQDGDCISGYWCENLVCVNQEWCSVHSEECSPYICNTGSHSCLQYCNSNDECISGYHCESQSCVVDQSSSAASSESSAEGSSSYYSSALSSAFSSTSSFFFQVWAPVHYSLLRALSYL